MGNSTPDVSVVIVSYNTKDLLAQCLCSVFEQTPNLSLEVIVVDNASTDDSCHMVEEEFPTVRLIANENNDGISKANNQGIRASSGRHILLLNPDTVILDRSIERMVAFLDSRPHIGACGCTLSHPDGTYQRSALPLPTVWSAFRQYSALFDRIPILARLLAPDWIDRPDQTRPVGYCSTACLLVSRACIKDVGLFDESFFLYGDDVDWCEQMWQAGWPVFYLADGRVIHYEGASTRHNVTRRLGELRGTLQYLRKWRGTAYARICQVVVWVCSLYRYVKRRWSQPHTPDEIRFLSEEIAFYRTILTGRFQESPMSSDR